MGGVPRYESWVDRQVREAIERGDFDNLPGYGKPLRDISRDGDDWWIKAKMERENISAVLPSALQLRREREEIQRTLADVPTEARVREIVEELNTRIREHYMRPREGPFIAVRTLNVDETVAEWRRRRKDFG